jgi:hypothetical protein
MTNCVRCWLVNLILTIVSFGVTAVGKIWRLRTVRPARALMAVLRMKRKNNEDIVFTCGYTGSADHSMSDVVLLLVFRLSDVNNDDSSFKDRDVDRSDDASRT